MLDQEHQSIITNEASYAIAQWTAAGSQAHSNQRDLARPHVAMKPKVYPDGNMWCALYGDNIQEGVCGFGETPEKACIAFDLAWLKGTTQPKS